MKPSIFTRIINGEIPCHKIYEDDDVIAFLDIHPVIEGHTLVVPKQQIDPIWELSEQAYTALWAKVRVIATELQAAMGTQRVVSLVEGFDVAHAHVHLLPVDTAKQAHGPQDFDTEPDHAALAAVASKISASINN